MAYSSNQSNAYIRMLNDAATRLPIDYRQMFSYDFVSRLCRLRDFRNCVMHAGAPSANDLDFVKLFIFGGDQLDRGEFISCLIEPLERGK